jgi:ACT domain-containing protein
MNLVITVVGQDKVGIVAKVSAVVASNQGNIIDLSQRVMSGGLFTMIMQINLLDSEKFNNLQRELEELEKDLNVKIMVQREDIFRAMHRI